MCHAIFSRFCTKLIVGRLSHLCVRRVGSAHPGAPHVEVGRSDTGGEGLTERFSACDAEFEIRGSI